MYGVALVDGAELDTWNQWEAWEHIDTCPLWSQVEQYLRCVKSFDLCRGEGYKVHVLHVAAN